MSENQNLNLPYFDILLEDFRQGKTEVVKGFGLHVHWGYWDNPAKADGSIDDFVLAAENLARRVCDAGGANDGKSILDCGCGFGGTIASLNNRFSGMQLVGLNIDSRQLERAKEQVKPGNNNQIEFVQGDACQLPFADNSFDLVLAVECIFHFHSRQKFFQEAQRVLKKGGKLALCDFVPRQAFIPLVKFGSKLTVINGDNYYGYVDSSFSISTYRKLAETTGFKSILEEDITLNTLPTYPVIRRMQESHWATAIAQLVSHLGLIRYFILAYVKV